MAMQQTGYDLQIWFKDSASQNVSIISSAQALFEKRKY